MVRIIMHIFIYILLLNSMYCKPRVIVIGFDGADSKLIKKWQDQLPNIKKITEQGCFLPLATTNPAHSPVAWATFATGNNPGKHRIFGFLKRSIGQYKPEYAVAKAEFREVLSWWQRIAVSVLLGLLVFTICFFIFRKKRYNLIIPCFLAVVITSISLYCLLHFIPQKVPFPVSLKQGVSFWTVAGEQNIKTEVVMAPIAFPAEKVEGGHLLCGFGVPDVLQTNGTWFVFGTQYNDIYSTETGGWKIPIVKKQDYETMIMGPKNLLVHEKYAFLLDKVATTEDFNTLKTIRNEIAEVEQQLNILVPMKIEKIDSGNIKIKIQNSSQDISLQKWSDWFLVHFKISPLLSLYAITRLYVSSIEPELEIYMSPLQFYPGNLPPNISISHPKNYAQEVMEKNGIYPTLGWAAATNALKDNAISEEAFWEDLQNIIEARQRIFFDALNKKQDLLVGVFYFPDRASHMYWRFVDPQHPLHEKDSPHQDKLLDVYKKMDEIIGMAYQKINKDDILMVVSDHGFESFRWQVNINTWLLQNGYLYLKQNQVSSQMQVNDLFSRERLLKDIDWTKTKAYAIGLGKIFINLEGREPEGIVKKDDYLQLRSEIIQKLLAFQHQDEQVITQAYAQEDIFSGPFSHEAADIVIGFAQGYRVSWQTSLGGVPKDIIEKNELKWSGDHCSVDPSFVPGIFICNKKISRTEIHLSDIAPSIFNIFNIENVVTDGKKFDVLK